MAHGERKKEKKEQPFKAKPSVSLDEEGCLEFAFPELGEKARLFARIHRTLRIPDDNKAHPLPPSLGSFRPRHVEDFRGNLSGKTMRRGGVMIPMWQSEALWIEFISPWNWPFAVKCAAGKTCALSGKAWSEGLGKEEQDYLVAPNQRWLDGFVVDGGLVRQFVAMPLGAGYSAEEQITGKGEWGGLQLAVFPMKKKDFEIQESLRALKEEGRRIKMEWEQSAGDWAQNGPNQWPLAMKDNLWQRIPPWPPIYGQNQTITQTHGGGGTRSSALAPMTPPSPPSIPFIGMLQVVPGAPRLKHLDLGLADDLAKEIKEAEAMALAPGGLMRQKALTDPHGIGVWSKTKARVFIHLIDARRFGVITGKEPDHLPPCAADYAAAGLPWFEVKAEGPGIKGSAPLKAMDSVAALGVKKSQKPLPENESCAKERVVQLAPG